MSKSTLPPGRSMGPEVARRLAAELVTSSRARYGDATMHAPPPTDPPAPTPAPQPAPAPAPGPAPAPAPGAPQRPDGVSEAEWAALGDPGKTALVRERQRATAAEQALAAARTAQPPAPAPAPGPKPADVPKGPDGQPDIAALVQQAVTAAMTPLMERDAQREAIEAASKVQEAVTAAAAARFHDASDALVHVDLASLTDGNGRPDQQKITTALDELVTRKPHLAKVIDPRRQAPLGVPIGAGGPTAAPLDDRVKATLARMQQSTGVKFVEG